MPLLFIEALPPRTTKGTLVRLLVQVGGIDRKYIGKISVDRRSATVEVPDDWASRLVTSLDGTPLDNRHLRVSCRLQSLFEDDDYFSRLVRLLKLEAQAEAEKMLREARRLPSAEAERRGNSLVRLTMRDSQAGLGGRVIAVLAKRDRKPLPWHRLTVGSPVMMSVENGSSRATWRGIVCAGQRDHLQVALDVLPDVEEGAPLRIDLSHDEVARRRQQAALDRAAAAAGDRLAYLRDVLLGEKAFSFHDIPPPETLDAWLNESQQEAVRFALRADDVAVIHGPPGTGKTTTLVELIRQAVRRGEKVLACAPSNLAVDNLLERLIAAGQRAVRLGHPARVLPQLRENTLDLLVDRHEDLRLARRLVKEASALRDRAARYTRAKPEPGARKEMRAEARDLLADARRLEAQVVAQILDRAPVLCATTTALDSEILGQRSFDLAVIDEACQTTEPGCWIPLLRCGRVVLAGDHCQLPPTVVSREAAKEGFGVSMLERLMAEHGSNISRRLDVQYRMHADIAGFSSGEFYDGSLLAHDSVRGHLLCDLEGVAANDLTMCPLHFIDTAGADFDEELEPDGVSRRNPAEVRKVGEKVAALLAAGVSPGDVAVIAPYSAQVRLLREMLREEGVEIDSVDGFQGREKEAIVISLVRSNRNGEIGFLADVRRINVALTRARRKLIVVGDSSTIGGHSFYARLLDYFATHEAHHSVWEDE